MRKWGLWGIEVAMLAGLSFAMPAQAGDLDGDDPPAARGSESSTWYKDWFKSKEKHEDKKPEFRKDNKADKEARAAQTKHNAVVKEAANQRGLEEAALLRRLAVCDQLMLIAIQKKDDALLHQAEVLDKRVREVYAQRTANLPASRVVSAGEEPNTETNPKEDKP